MNSISTASTYQSALLNILSAQRRQADAQNQVSTGKKANDLKGFGSEAVGLTAAKSVKTRLDSHVNNATTLAATLNIQDEALSQMADAVQGARQAVAEALATGSGAGLMQTLQGRFSQLADSLNIRFQGRYLFSGGQHQTAPVAATTLANLSAAPTIASLFANDQMRTTDRVDDNTVLDTGFVASNLGAPAFQLFQTIDGMNTPPAGPISGPLTAAQQTQLQGLLAGFDSAYTGLNDAVAQNGSTQNRLESLSDSLKDRQVTMEGLIGDMTNVDGAEAISRLELAQVALQASAQMFATLNSSSLLNVLSR